MNDITKVQEIVQQLNIIDDTLFQKMAEDIGFCEEMLSTIRPCCPRDRYGCRQWPAGDLCKYKD